VHGFTASEREEQPVHLSRNLFVGILNTFPFLSLATTPLTWMAWLQLEHVPFVLPRLCHWGKKTTSSPTILGVLVGVRKLLQYSGCRGYVGIVRSWCSSGCWSLFSGSVAVAEPLY